MQHRVFVGLGNPGQEYAKTRHNLGIRALDYWIMQMNVKGYAVQGWKKEDHMSADVAHVDMDSSRITCLFPLTRMNSSGDAVAAYMNYHKIPLSDVLIIHDDMQFPLGKVQLKEKGSAAGHNGVRSIHIALGTQDIARLRLGIGRPPEGIDSRDYVLGEFSAEEEAVVEQMIEEAGQKLTEIAAIPNS